jgi:hypothetical protein
MLFAIVGAVIAFNVALYMVLATLIREMKRKSSYVEIPELKGMPPVLRAGPYRETTSLICKCRSLL